jgi:hypothetical protein
VESLGLTGVGGSVDELYPIDVYRGDALAIRNPIDYWCYIAITAACGRRSSVFRT